MVFQQNIKSKLAAAFASLYLFAFLFSANIHQHNGGSFYKDFQFKSGSKNFSKESTVNNGEDCLSCHFASAPVLLPVVENFVWIKQVREFSAFSAFSVDKLSAPHFHYYLRGPPNFI